VGGQLGRFLEGDTHRGTRLLLDIQPDALGDDVLSEEQGATDILVTPDIGSVVGSFILATASIAWPRLAFLESSMIK
jgi:hypothetical protein